MNFLSKLTSRKFLMCLAGVVTGIAVLQGANAESINTIAGAITVLGSIVTYIVAEGKVDATSAKATVDQIEIIKDELNED